MASVLMFLVGLYLGGLVSANAINICCRAFGMKPLYGHFGLVWPYEILSKDWWRSSR